MTAASSFRPSWSSPPGDTIRDVIAERNIEEDELAQLLGVPTDTLHGLLSGKTSLSMHLARHLAAALGGTPAFWLTRDSQYHDDLAHAQATDWLASLPVRDMVRFGWIERFGTRVDQIAECLRFFGTTDVSSWDEHFATASSATRFRVAQSSPKNGAAVAAWMRRAEIMASALDCQPWAPAAFRALLPHARALTRIKDPRSFVPQLTELCADAGVAVVFIPTPLGCPASGAARFLTPNKALLALSARYLSDDHLWFTFFHEAAHLLMHDHSVTYIDDTPLATSSSRREENEADSFAANTLLPDLLAASLSRPDSRSILALAHRAGVAPGVVVGQLQHAGILSFKQGNRLKRRYRWVGASLEMA